MKPEKLFYVVAAMVVGLSALSSSQSSAPRTVKANIPFDFMLGDTRFQPGQYELSVTWQGTIWLKGDNAKTKAVNSQTAFSQTSASQTKLVFHHVGDYYFLEQVWVEGETSGREVPPMRLEKEIMSRAKPETVEVLARK
jgi:hypothetical protein